MRKGDSFRCGVCSTGRAVLPPGLARHGFIVGKGRKKKGFILGGSRGRVRPGNCSVGRLFGDPRFTEAVLKFLADTGVGKIKKGVVIRGEVVE